ncbi:MAG: type II/IV secretion system protein, partial [Candidatus Delongbacteria bacterium]|nr:type II/IV secretion system protein [Candidatus Delongbacteria bacterium]
MIKKSRFGQLLLKKEIVDLKTLEKAISIQVEDDSTDPRSLGEILVDDFKINHHTIYGLLAELYAFRSLEISLSELDENQLKHTKEILSKFPEKYKKELIYKRILPYKVIQGRRPTLIVLAADPTNKITEQIPINTEYKKYEVVYCKLETIEHLIETIAPQKNEFLELLQEVEEQMDDIGSSKSKADIDEYALDDEINKSLLVNLFEGCLMEAVRKDASDIHIIPYHRSSVDFYFRIDGKLIRWHRQDRTSPEAISAVVKDRAV